jgi:glycosyltransferase involved in cell wall biosynthesis
MPKLSIIIPTYNSARTIQRCLSSIRIQTLTDFEIVVQDGGSSDRTVQLIQEFVRENRGITLGLRQEPDMGVYDAMNKAIRRANGEWLYFLGSDDELYDQNVLSKMLGSGKTADTDVLYGNVLIIGRASWAVDGAIYDGHFDLRKLLTKNICHQAIFYKAAFFRRVGEFNPKYVVCADWDFNMRCWAMGLFTYVDLVVAKFHAGGHSTKGRSDPHFGADAAENLIRYFNFSPSDPLMSAFCEQRADDVRRASRITPMTVLRVLARMLRMTRQE